MFHFRKNRNRYAGFPKPITCPFCTTIEQEHITQESAHHWVVPNRVMYDIWELRKVTDHLLVIPKRHVLNLNELTDTEQLDHMKLLADYEVKGYNIYARFGGSLQRSVPHQHTHLIKTDPYQARGSFILRNPYILLIFK